MTLLDIQTLLRFNQWATKRLIDSLVQMTQAQYVHDITSSHGSVRGTLTHLAGAEWIWLRRLRGEAAEGLPKADEFPDFPSLRTFWIANGNDIAEYAASLNTEDDVARIVSYRDLKGNRHAQPVCHIIQHMVNHSTYHRGQMTVLLRQLGLTPIGTDLITYFRETTPSG